MLTQADIEMIVATRDEITANRQHDIVVMYVIGAEDEITGELVNKETVEREVKSIITEISSNHGASDIYLDNGIKYEKGDVKFDVTIEVIADIAEMLEFIRHDEKLYTILAKDKKGIGKRNRYEMIARRAV